MKPSSSYILLPDELTYCPSVPKSVHDQVVIVVTVKLSSLIINKGPFIIYAGGGGGITGHCFTYTESILNICKS